tara:strand:+ start:603 stop:839 length:237 start_codon:yes stop_codon:yes gene_type:complete
MYGVVIAIMLAGASGSEAKLPIMVASYSTLDDCRLELVEISKLPGFKLVVSPLLSYSVAKEEGGDTTMAFCIKNLVSI